MNHTTPFLSPVMPVSTGAPSRSRLPRPPVDGDVRFRWVTDHAALPKGE
ncbi:hypothetical protein [Deinococcus aestuarii]|nr:hypothetical protein [Deinococcus aestuarii]